MSDHGFTLGACSHAIEAGKYTHDGPMESAYTPPAIAQNLWLCPFCKAAMVFVPTVCHRFAEPAKALQEVHVSAKPTGTRCFKCIPCNHIFSTAMSDQDYREATTP